MDLLKKGDRVKRIFTHAETGEEKVFYGTVTDDEIEFWDAISVTWDDNPQASLFPTDRMFLERVDESTS